VPAVGPLNRLGRLVTLKRGLVEYHFNYGSGLCHIRTVARSSPVADDLLVASDLLFVTRHFFICDERQIPVMRKLLLEETPGGELPGKILDGIRPTLTPIEQEALSGLSSLGLPPLGYSETAEPLRSFAKYSFFLVLGDPGRLASLFRMSFGRDILLLPVTVSLFRQFILTKLGEDANKEQMVEASRRLLEAYAAADCRSLRSLNDPPNQIMARFRWQ